MVDAIGSNVGRTSEVRVSAVSRVAAAPASGAPPETRITAPETVARRLAANPPVDADRVRQIKAAIASGDFPISPARITDRLIAARYEWMADDKA